MSRSFLSKLVLTEYPAVSFPSFGAQKQKTFVFNTR